MSVVVVACVLATAGTALAAAITNHSGFSAGQTVITFADASGDGTTAISSQYASKGVTFSGALYWYVTSYAGFGWPGSGGAVAANFGAGGCPCFNDVTATFAGTVERVGFDTFDNADSIELKAYRGGVLVDDQTFTNPGQSFVGIDVPQGFSVLVIHVFGPIDGAYLMDDFRFDGFVRSSAAPYVPPPPHAAVCAVPGNTNPFNGAPIAPGTFLDLLAAQITTDPHYKGATPAIFVEGKGLTCDPPPPGYTQQGYAGNDQHVAENFYPYWAPPPTR